MYINDPTIFYILYTMCSCDSAIVLIFVYTCMIIQGKMQYAHWNTYFASPERGKIMKVEAIPQEKNASGRRNTTANNKLFLNPKCV
jgi:hypothetical protein